MRDHDENLMYNAAQMINAIQCTLYTHINV